MKILPVHNYYQHTGGEDQSFEAERQMLRATRRWLRPIMVPCRNW